MTPLENEVIELVTEESGKRKEEVSLESTLLGDLGIDGDDAWEIIDRLHNKHKVDFSGFNFGMHFRNEPCLKGPYYLFRKLKYRDEHIAANKEPITVANLVVACETKAWKNDVSNRMQTDAAEPRR